MIIEWLMLIGEGIVNGFFAALPEVDLDEVVVSANDLYAPFSATIQSTGAWIPWQALAVMGPIVFGTYTVSLFARFLRVILGHIPLVGGNG